MVENGMYYVTEEFKNLVRNCGGQWNDVKKRPVVCLIESSEHKGMYWAIPMGKLNHRDAKGVTRIQRYLAYDASDIRSCYYHLGRTTAKSIFFISDAIPITEKYILEEHVGIDGNHYVIKNKQLSSELERKLFRLLAYENANPNSFRQHITAVKEKLISELEEEQK